MNLFHKMIFVLILIELETIPYARRTHFPHSSLHHESNISRCGSRGSHGSPL
jgi:hypothetical protein